MKVNKGSMMLCMLVGAAMLVLGGCATNGYDNQRGYHDGYGSSRGQCAMCGRVTDVQRVYADNGNNHDAAIGTVIGAVVGAALGNQVGKGDGRKAATVGGAVAGGAIGHHVGNNRATRGEELWRVDVRLNDGRRATVTQRDDPRVRVGDYVEVRGNRVYPQR